VKSIRELGKQDRAGKDTNKYVHLVGTFPHRLPSIVAWNCLSLGRETAFSSLVLSVFVSSREEDMTFQAFSREEVPG
jgi:hypothetical protein